MNITMIVSFVIVYEKLFEPLSARLGLFNHFPSLFDKALATLTRLSHLIFTVYIPRIIMKLRYILIFIFFVFGVIGLVIVFYHPKLSPPKTRRYQFFQLTHPFERFEYQMRDQFLSYINEDKDNVTNPLLIFIFGIEDTDLTHPFYPEDAKINQNKQKLIYNRNIDFYDPLILRWFDSFLKDLNRSDLFVNVQQTYSQWLTIGKCFFESISRGYTCGFFQVNYCVDLLIQIDRRCWLRMKRNFLFRKHEMRRLWLWNDY